jgi:hypothetical protein
VIGIIAALIAVLVPALAGGLKTANMAKSQSRLKQIATWMQAYASENREYIVPSQFDYTVSAATYPVKVRSHSAPATGTQYRGTWTDILWTYGKMKVHLAEYDYDSPDKHFYDTNADYTENPFRSSGFNARDYQPGSGVATPFGTGAHEAGDPGYFAANNFFDARPGLPANPMTSQAASGPNGRWYVTGQIKSPERSLYLVDSLAGETIEPDTTVPGPWASPVGASGGGTAPQLQIDYRYNGACLIMFLDGHSSAEAPWADLLNDLEGSRKIKVLNPTQN